MSGRFNLADYATVDERIDTYWKSHPKPEGSIQTEIIWVSEDGSSVAIKATVYQGDRILATGIAQEERLTGLDQYGKPVKGANTSSWWENCETSAIGRALANMGMSLSKRASREEMEKVQRYEDRDDSNAASKPPQRQQEQPPRPPANAYSASNMYSPTPPAAPAPSGPQPAARDEHPLLATIRDDTADPKVREKALHNYYMSTTTLAQLAECVTQTNESGMPEVTRDKARVWHTNRIIDAVAPAIAG